MLKAITLSVCAAFLLRATCHAAELADDTAFAAPKFSTTAEPPPRFRIPSDQGIEHCAAWLGRQVDPDFAGIRSGLAALGIGYIGWSSNSFYNNMLSAERTTFGNQTYNGQKPTFFTSNVMFLTYQT